MEPTLTHTGGRLFDAVAPLARTADAAHGHALAWMSAGIASMLDDVADLSRDGEDGTPGWAGLFDLNRVPARYLPWLAQFVGVRIPPGLSEAAQRQRIRETDGFRRGSPGAIKGAARQHLAGTRTVYLTERHGSAYGLTVATLENETPDPAAVVAAVKAQTPAGIVLAVTVVRGGTYQTLRDTHPDYADVRSTFVTYTDMRNDPARQ